jgi:hypothetical protein
VGFSAGTADTLPGRVRTQSGGSSTYLKRSVEKVIQMGIVKMMMAVLGQAPNNMLDLLIDLVQQVENLFRQFRDGSRFAPFHADSEEAGFNKVCARLVRDAMGDSSSAIRRPFRVRR